jgi:Thrombospondin type 1 domain.
MYGDFYEEGITPYDMVGKNLTQYFTAQSSGVVTRFVFKMGKHLLSSDIYIKITDVNTGKSYTSNTVSITTRQYPTVIIFQELSFVMRAGNQYRLEVIGSSEFGIYVSYAPEMSLTFDGVTGNDSSIIFSFDITYSPINGDWSDWVSGTCSATCGGGDETQTRTYFPAENGGTNYSGDTTRIIECNTTPCPQIISFGDFNDEWASYYHMTCQKLTQYFTASSTGIVSKFSYKFGKYETTPEIYMILTDMTTNKSYTSSTKTVEGDPSIITYDVPNFVMRTGTVYRLEVVSSAIFWFYYGYYPGMSFTHTIYNAPTTTNEYTIVFSFAITNSPINGEWSDWVTTSPCSATCGGGDETQTRTYFPAENGGIDYSGDTTRIIECNTTPCPVPGGWSIATCSATCGGGTETIIRECNNPLPLFGGTCSGSAMTTVSCSTTPCPGTWGDWIQGTCSPTCGEARTETQTRECLGLPCDGETTRQISCPSIPCPINGGWTTNWVPAIPTTVSFGNNPYGYAIRGNSFSTTFTSSYTGIIRKFVHNIRKILTGTQSVSMIFTDVLTNKSYTSTETIIPSTTPPGTTIPITIIPDTYVNISEGKTYKIQLNSSADIGYDCSPQTGMTTISSQGGYTMTDNNVSLTFAFEVLLPVAEGTETCSATCGGGTRYEFKTCTNPSPQNGGADCSGSGIQTLDCNTQACPVDCQVSDWGDCSKDCGGGSHTRTITTQPLNGGTACPILEEACNTQACPVDCQVSDWGPCSDSGIKTRSIIIDSANGGTSCPALTEFCTNCKVSDWGLCSESGIKTRTVITDATNGGTVCPALTESCTNCKVSDWGSCSATCGDGTQTRTITTQPLNGGEACPTLEQSCNNGPCPIDCKVSDWKTCSATCGDGTQTRDVLVAPLNGGEACPTLEQSCNNGPCPINGGWSGWVSSIPTTVSFIDTTYSVFTGNGQSSYSTFISPHTGIIKKFTHSIFDASPVSLYMIFTDMSTNESYTSEPAEPNITTFDVPNIPITKGTQYKVQLLSSNSMNFMYYYSLHDGLSTLVMGNQVQNGSFSFSFEMLAEGIPSCESGKINYDIRTCMNPKPQYGGSECKDSNGNLALGESRNAPCPINGGWAGECSATCGAETETITRTCTNPSPQYGGAECQGEATISCNTLPCPINGEWSGWSYSECDAKCDSEGTRTMTHTCTNPAPDFGGDKCIDSKGNESLEETLTISCSGPNCPVNGGWSEFTPYGTCSATCGGTIKQRRYCTNPEPLYGGQCTGFNGDMLDMEETEIPCGPPCPVNGEWGDFVPTTECSATCGGGTRQITRECIGYSNGGNCDGVTTETREEFCNTQPCPVDGKWSSEWTYSECNAPCTEGGTRTRTKTCIGYENGGSCYDENNKALTILQETVGCDTSSCPVDGKWSSEWTYGPCSATCGDGGTRSRRKECIGYLNGGSCYDENGIRTTELEETVACENNPACPPIHGDWSDWSPQTCSLSCGRGRTETRTRTCTNPAPEFGGNPCLVNGIPSTEETKTEACTNDYLCTFINGTSSCTICPPEDGKWSDWIYSECSPTCGLVGGIQERTRTCTNPAPELGGSCTMENGVRTVFPEIQRLPCLNDPCPWGDFSPCSATCGEGTKTRICTGEMCIDSTGKPTIQETVKCDNKCPVDGKWGGWIEGSCSPTCGPGERIDTRTCIPPQNGGVECQTDSDGHYDTKTELCNNGICPVNGEWDEWEMDSKTGTKKRLCVGYIGAGYCVDSNNLPSHIETIPCENPNCLNEPTGWGPWINGTCFPTCGADGTRTDTRTCGIEKCAGLPTRTVSCNGGACPKDGTWSTWELDPTTETKSHYCIGMIGGGSCFDSNNTRATVETVACETSKCLGWSEWTTGTCSPTCGGGSRTDTRTCLQNEVEKCVGLATRTELCNNGDCPEEPTPEEPTPEEPTPEEPTPEEPTPEEPTPEEPVDEWDVWVNGACSVTCGGGIQVDTRKCLGTNCIGGSTRTLSCNTQACPPVSPTVEKTTLEQIKDIITEHPVEVVATGSLIGALVFLA